MKRPNFEDMDRLHPDNSTGHYMCATSEYMDWLEAQLAEAEGKLDSIRKAVEASNEYVEHECFFGPPLGTCGNEGCIACTAFNATYTLTKYDVGSNEEES